MEVARLVLSYIQALVWPAIVFIAIMLFRKELYGVLSRLKTANFPGGVSLDFADEIRAAIDLSRKVKPPTPPKGQEETPMIPLTQANARMLSLGLRPSPSGLDFAYYRSLAVGDPNLSLAGLRMEIEILARNLAQGFKVRLGGSDSIATILRKLREDDAITTPQLRLAQQVARLCDAAVHGRRVSREEADSVIDVGAVLADQYIAWLSWGFPDGWKPKMRTEQDS